MSLRAYVILVCVVVLLAFASGVAAWLSRAVSALLVPTTPVGTGVGASRSFFDSLREVQSLASTVARLEQENAQLTSQLAGVREQMRDEQQIAGELMAAQTASAVTAAVILGSPTQLVDTVTIDRGTQDGVRLGDPVLAQGFLAGTVAETWSHRAQVRLITDTASVVPVRLQESRAQGLLHGNLSGLVLTDLPVDVVVKEREVILTSGLGGLLPADIPVGVATGRISAESEILQRLTVTSPIIFRSLEHVAILVAS